MHGMPRDDVPAGDQLCANRADDSLYDISHGLDQFVRARRDLVRYRLRNGVRNRLRNGVRQLCSDVRIDGQRWLQFVRHARAVRWALDEYARALEHDSAVVHVASADVFAAGRNERAPEWDSRAARRNACAADHEEAGDGSSVGADSGQGFGDQAEFSSASAAIDRSHGSDDGSPDSTGELYPARRVRPGPRGQHGRMAGVERLRDQAKDIPLPDQRFPDI